MVEVPRAEHGQKHHGAPAVPDHATEAIVDTGAEKGNGYIWHTTGSGKTLTSFKASQILTKLPGIHKVVFVVDRKDLDFQTMKKFNSFRKTAWTAPPTPRRSWTSSRTPSSLSQPFRS